MTDDEKAKMAEKDAEIAKLKDQLAGKTTDPEPEDLTPSPTQAELDAMKRGEYAEEPAKSGSYKTRQSRA